MPTIAVYPHAEFPAIYKWQAIAFMRMEWPSIFQGDNLYMPETYPPEFDPVHFVVAQDDSLLSYAALMKLDLIHHGSEFRMVGFGNMLTFPPFRRQGWVTTHSPRRLGQPNQFEEYSASRMMMFFSETGRASKESFETQPLYIDGPW